MVVFDKDTLWDKGALTHVIKTRRVDQCVDSNCTFLEETDPTFTSREDYQIKTGVCSAQTEALLLEQESCILPLYSQADNILVSLQTLIWSTCSWQTWQAWKPGGPATTTTRSVFYDPLHAFHQRANPNHIGKLQERRKCLFFQS